MHLQQGQNRFLMADVVHGLVLVVLVRQQVVLRVLQQHLQHLHMLIANGDMQQAVVLVPKHVGLRAR